MLAYVGLALSLDYLIAHVQTCMIPLMMSHTVDLLRVGN